MHSYSFVHNPPSACSVSNHQRWAKTNHVCALKWKEGCQGTITILKSVPLCTQTYRQANRKVDRQTERPTGRQTCRKTGRKADRQADIQAGRQTGRKADRQKDRKTGRKADKQADIQTDRQTGAQADRCAGRHADRVWWWEEGESLTIWWTHWTPLNEIILIFRLMPSFSVETSHYS